MKTNHLATLLDCFNSDDGYKSGLSAESLFDHGEILFVRLKEAKQGDSEFSIIISPPQNVFACGIEQQYTKG
jgi:hypothetical protein